MFWFFMSPFTLSYVLNGTRADIRLHGPLVTTLWVPAVFATICTVIALFRALDPHREAHLGPGASSPAVGWSAVEGCNISWGSGGHVTWVTRGPGSKHRQCRMIQAALTTSGRFFVCFSWHPEGLCMKLPSEPELLGSGLPDNLAS